MRRPPISTRTDTLVPDTTLFRSRMRSVLSRVFRDGVATVRCDKDVAADLRGAIATPKPKHFAAITRPSEVGALMRALDDYKGYPVTRMAMRLSDRKSTRLNSSH